MQDKVLNYIQQSYFTYNKNLMVLVINWKSKLIQTGLKNKNGKKDYANLPAIRKLIIHLFNVFQF